IDHLHIDLPRPMIRDKSLDFSFSGLKTAVLNLVIKKHIFPDIDLKFSGMQEKREPYPDKKHLIAEIAAAFQAAVVDVLVTKALDAVRVNKMDTLVVAGGVACNSALRQTIQDKTTEAGIRLCIPAQKYCGDNAAMIGMASIRYFQHGLTADLRMNAVSRFEIY
ncbi:MAG: hypothetical protein JW920_06660, partial [Deltaproteobacteria bacterium]|nr:hypothetical protein [Deltaproteobacteria bacterium]